jgi:hypothetical protein
MPVTLITFDPGPLLDVSDSFSKYCSVVCIMQLPAL